jgi:peptidoglycan/xylan/chitin deacetylase (PgdA/CDA1 family)
MQATLQRERVSAASATDAWIALCYHDVQPVMPTGGGGPSHFTVPTASFELMLDTIAQTGAIGCSLEDAMASPGQRRVAITFDDANIGQYENAFPALVARGMTATFYATTDWIGTPGFCTWDHLREMKAAGMSIQSHTCSHPFLSELTEGNLLIELQESKREIDRQLGQDTREIAFPGGDPPRRSLRYVMAAAGYQVAVGTRWGMNRDGSFRKQFVKRCTVRGELTPEFAQRVVSADPWLAASWVAKEATLRRLRSTLGASRYARWRRVFLDVVAEKEKK